MTDKQKILDAFDLPANCYKCKKTVSPKEWFSAVGNIGAFSKIFTKQLVFICDKCGHKMHLGLTACLI